MHGPLSQLALTEASPFQFFLSFNGKNAPDLPGPFYLITSSLLSFTKLKGEIADVNPIYCNDTKKAMTWYKAPLSV
jgi:hypothetical protein